MTFWSALWRWLRFPLALFALLGCVLVASVAWLLSGHRYQTFLTEHLSTLLQSQVRVAHSQLSFFRGFGVVLQGVEVRREEINETTFTAERLVVFLDVRALFRGQLIFSRVESGRPTIRMTEHTKGMLEVFGALLRSSEDVVPVQPDNSGWFTPTLSIRQLIISDGEIFYRPNEHGPSFSVTNASLQFMYVPGHGVTARIDAELGKTGELGAVTIDARAPSWETRNDLQQVEWVGNVHLERFLLRRIGQSFGGDWPEATLTFDGEATGEGTRPLALSGTVHVSEAHFGQVQVQNGTLNLKKFHWGEGLESGEPLAWTTLLPTIAADFELKEVRGTLANQTLAVILLAGSGTLQNGNLTIADGRGNIGAKSRLLGLQGTVKQLASPEGPVLDLVIKAELGFREDLHRFFALLSHWGLPDLNQQVQKPQGGARIELAVRTPEGGGTATYDGSMHLREAAFYAPLLKREVQGMTGTVTFSNTALLFDTVALSIGPSTLQVSGRMDDYQQAARRKVDLQLSANLDLQDLHSFGNLPLLLTTLSQWGLPDLSPQVQKLQGGARIELAVRTLSGAALVMYEGSVQLREAAFYAPLLKREVQGMTGTITFSNTALLFDTVALSIGPSTLQVSGRMDDYQQAARRKVDVQLSADLDLHDLNALVTDAGKFWTSTGSGVDFIRVVKNPQGRAIVRLNMRTAGSPTPMQYDGRVTFQQAAFHLPPWNLSVSDLSGPLRIDRSTLSTEGLTLMVGKGSLRAQGALQNYLSAQRTGEMRLTFSSMPDAEVQAFLPPQLLRPQGGLLSGKVGVNFLANGTMKTQGEIALARILLDPLAEVLRPVEVEEGELVWEGQSGMFVITRGSISGSAVHGRGRFISFSPLNIEATLNVPEFTVENIFDLDEHPQEQDEGPKDDTALVRVELNAGNLTYKTFRANDVQAVLHWHGRQADIDVVGGKTAGGAFHGKGVVWPDLNALFIAPQLTNIDAAQFLNAFGGVPDKILTGTLSGGGNIYIADRHQWDSPARWQAQLSLEVANGVAQRIPILVRLWSAVSLQSVFSLQLPSLPTSGLSFSSLSGDLAIGGGLAMTKNLSLRSSAVQINASGEINLANRTVDLNTSLSPLHGITSSVAKVPLAGQVLARGADFLTTLSFRVSGPYHEPTVTPLFVGLGSR